MGLLQRVRAFFLRVSFVRGGISVAAGRTSGREFGTRAKHCVGARHLLCSSHSFELEIRLHYPHRFLNPDYSVFDCGRVALSEDRTLGASLHDGFASLPNRVWWLGFKAKSEESITRPLGWPGFRIDVNPILRYAPRFVRGLRLSPHLLFLKTRGGIKWL